MKIRCPVRVTVWRSILAVVFVAGFAATWTRFTRGLGAATDLSDAFPWGLWIGFDVMVGVGLAAGGFVIAATVHLFQIKKYEPIARASVLTAFLGYLLVIVALLFDLGRPYRIWHSLVMWNPHSVMFEVAWCVMLYTVVLALEFSPLLFERLGLKRPLAWIRRVYVPLVIVGVLLSTMHQSSLGTLYVIVPDKLHGLWYTPLLPVFFFISAIAAGLAITIFESFMSARAFGKRLERDALEGLARIIVVALAVYAIWRGEDLAGRGQLGLAFRVTPESVLFWGEVGLGVILPMILFAIPRVRRSEQGLFFGAVLTVMGFVINRLNVAITGMEGWSEASYFPTWMELAVTMSLFGGGFVLFGLAVRHLPVFPDDSRAGGEAGATGTVTLTPRPAVSGWVLVGLWSLLLLGAVSVAFGSRNGHPPSDPADVSRGASSQVIPASDLDLPADYTFPETDASPGPVVFSHDTHVDAAAPACATCHSSLFRINEPGRPFEGEATPDRLHEELCGTCHDGASAFSVEEGCEVCHSQ